MVHYRQATIYIRITYFSYLYLFLPGNIIVHTPNQGTNRESTLIILFIKGGMPFLAGNKHPSINFFVLVPHVFYLSREKVRVRSVGNGHQSGNSRADTKNKNINKEIKDISIQE